MTLRTVRVVLLPALCTLLTAAVWAQDKPKDSAPAKAPAAAPKAAPAAPKKEAAPTQAPAAAPAAKDAAPAAKADSGMDDKQKMSYAVGVRLGKMIEDGVSLLDMKACVDGLTDSIGKKQIKIDEAEVGQLLQGFQKQMMEAKFGANKAEGEKFLTENSTKEGVKTLPSGLQYKVLTEGTGRTPKATDTVSTNYRGTFINGTEFDSSYKRNQPAMIPVNRVIPGWTEALQLMKEGGKWELYVPYAMAYGEEGRPPQIPPFSVLVFQVELLKIVDQPAAAPGESKPVTIAPKPAAAPVTPPPVKK